MWPAGGGSFCWFLSLPARALSGLETWVRGERGSGQRSEKAPGSELLGWTNFIL